MAQELQARTCGVGGTRGCGDAVDDDELDDVVLRAEHDPHRYGRVPVAPHVRQGLGDHPAEEITPNGVEPEGHRATDEDLEAFVAEQGRLGTELFLRRHPPRDAASEFERGFIRAEVIGFDELMECGTMAVAKEKGLVRSEGKDYVMQDGDIVLFRFNV